MNRTWVIVGVSVIGISALFGIVLASIGAGSLLSLVAAFAAVGVIGIALYGIYVLLIVKVRTLQYGHAETMAAHGILFDGRKYDQIRKPESAPQLPEPAPNREPVHTDPRRRLLLELCLMTVRAEGYGADSKRLITADDAQAYSKKYGGQFADRNSWDKASKYGQDKGLIYTQKGGPEQGTKVNAVKVGGYTVTDLLGVLMEHDQELLSALAPLPTIIK